MIRILKTGILAIVTLLLLSACWDQHLLKDVKLFMAASFDLTPDGKILDELTSPTIKKNQEGGGVSGYTISTGIGNTPREARGDVDRKAEKVFDASKLRVLIIGNELAKKDIYSVLDLFYRDPKSALSAKVVVAEGMGKDLLRINFEEEKVSSYLYDLLESQEIASLIPAENIQSICAEMFDPGEDFVLPFLRPSEDRKTASVEGIALFNDRKFTGRVLTGEEAVIFLLLDGNSGKSPKFTKRIAEGESFNPPHFVSFTVKKAKETLEVKVKNNRAIANINLKLKIDITDYAKNQLYNKHEITKLNNKLSEMLTNDAVAAIKTLQEANSDSLGIGRRLIALYPDYWKHVDWKKEYPNVVITPKVDVEIVGHGIID
ncbi:Ger(x)C family spore germination protein [Bacillus sp. ISL-35]|uniref:Ger(x)C family spore germination protein n=1 Tax=Bacillus sp. ISL-35 TaxID=2819122 RepID=UPI001BE65A28|nr:Ger(x)C family spore germination protein [Bacillus sp. ISL-35]MBT2679936.1 Ger(x)C family spore germination protein [Bacillus sp. ISL-35]MBT2703089.1 Ger(x)C family spore germination protein [Chryseobacterium sp. ISL-80]